jgi:protein-tyrosine phosphatase
MGQVWRKELFSNECQEVCPGLYIGHVGCAQDAAVLRGCKITRIVDVSAQEYRVPPGVQRLRLPVPDVPWYDIRSIFGRTNAFIAQGLSQGECVLVHCHWGRSRSASVVLAFLMAFYHMTLDDSLSWLKRKRSVTSPNFGFMQYLRRYERELQYYRSMIKKS